MESAIVSTDQSPAIIDNWPWYQLPNEPHDLYSRFARYYLTQPSTNRSLLQAYRSYRIDKAKSESELEIARETTSISEGWSKACYDWQWIERASARDAYLTDQLLEQNGQALLTHRATKLHYWTQIVEDCSRELASRDKRDMSVNLLTRTIKTIDQQITSALPQQPQQHFHLVALHPELQAMLRDAIEERK